MPPVSSTERARLRQLFGRVLEFEAGCDAETHVRSFVGSPDGAPAGVAWLPPGLPAVPHLDHKRVVELAGPRGQTLFYVPLSELSTLLRQAAADRGLPEADLHPLASLAAEASEVAVHGLFDLLFRLARR